MPARVPAGFPPILLSIDFADQQPALPSDVGARYADGQLRLAATNRDGNAGAPFSAASFRDVLLQAQVSLADGADDDLYGVYVRSPAANLYYTFALSPAGQVVISRYDGQYVPQVAGPLAADMQFARGPRQPNVFQVVAVGPSLTFILNRMVVTAVLVDPRYKEGLVGVYVHHGTTSARAEVGVDWVQVRAILPEPT
jgi:hypothetical protein